MTEREHGGKPPDSLLDEAIVTCIERLYHTNLRQPAHNGDVVASLLARPHRFVAIAALIAAHSPLAVLAPMAAHVARALSTHNSALVALSVDGTEVRMRTKEEAVQMMIEEYVVRHGAACDIDALVALPRVAAWGTTANEVRDVVAFSGQVELSRDGSQVQAVDLDDRVQFVVEKMLSAGGLARNRVLHKLVLQNFNRSIALSTLLTLPPLVHMSGVDEAVVARACEQSNKLLLNEDRSEVARVAGLPATPPSKVERSNMSLGEQISYQVEFWFGDLNFSFDRHLNGLAEAHPDGFVPIAELLQFRKLKKLSSDVAVIARALHEHASSVEVSADGQFVRRRSSLRDRRRMVSFGMDANAGHTNRGNRENVFSVLSWNILGDFLCTLEQFPYASPAYLTWEYRFRAIKRQLVYYRADIVCLQEVQSTVPFTKEHPDNHALWLVRRLTHEGYGYRYIRKTRRLGQKHNKVDIGNLVAWNNHVWDFVTYREVCLSTALFARCDTLEKRRVYKSGQSQVAVFVVLAHKASGERVIVCTTHLTSNFMAPDVQVAQAHEVLLSLEEFNSGSNTPIVLCGDFNSGPHSAVYELCVKGRIASDHSVYETARAAGRPMLHGEPEHTLRLDSAYRRVLDEEPPFTNYVSSFSGTLDYIFYSRDSLKPISVLDMPTERSVTQEVALPSSRYPSDHLPLLTYMRFINDGSRVRVSVVSHNMLADVWMPRILTKHRVVTGPVEEALRKHMSFARRMERMQHAMPLSYLADIQLLQEVTSLEHLPHAAVYDHAFCTHQRGADHCVIRWRRSLFRVLSQRTFVIDHKPSVIVCLALVDCPAVLLVVGNTQLPGGPRKNSSHVATFFNEMNAARRHAIERAGSRRAVMLMGGDFNRIADDPDLATIIGGAGFGEVAGPGNPAELVTEPAKSRKVDHIFYPLKTARVKETAVLAPHAPCIDEEYLEAVIRNQRVDAGDVRVSDHRPLFAQLELRVPPVK